MNIFKKMWAWCYHPRRNPLSELKKRLIARNEQAAKRIQKAVRAYQFRHNLGTKFNWHDLVFMHENSLALRNNDAKAGLAEKINGGRGDGYSLANFAFNPANPILEPENKQNLVLKETEQKFRHALTNNTCLIPACTLYVGSEQWKEIRYEGYRLLQSKTSLDHPDILIELTRQMNRHLSTIVQDCYEYQKPTNANIFHLIELGGAQNSYDCDSTLYPTGKCGTQNFRKEQILATIQERGLFAYANLKKIKTTETQKEIVKTVKNLRRRPKSITVNT